MDVDGRAYNACSVEEVAVECLGSGLKSVGRREEKRRNKGLV